VNKARMDKWLTREDADGDPERPEPQPESVIDLLHDILDEVTAVRQELEKARQRVEEPEDAYGNKVAARRYDEDRGPF